MKLIRFLYRRGRSASNIPKEENENQSIPDDASEKSDDDELPQIVITKTRSTDGVETILTTSFDTEEIGLSRDIDNKMSIHKEGKDYNCQIVKNRSLASTRSRDSTAALSIATSVSQSTETMDVHECTSSTCTMCNNVSKQSITFINVPALENNMINKLRTQPLHWYEMGRSFDELYREANRPDRKRREKNGYDCDNESSSGQEVTMTQTLDP